MEWASAQSAGNKDWAGDLAAARIARLPRGDQVKEIDVQQVPLADRAELLDAYRRQFGKMPTVSSVLRAPLDPADHPVFRITAAGVACAGT